MDKIDKLLFENADAKFRDFTSSLLPTVDKNSIIGVRVPTLRKIEKKFPEMLTRAEIEEFLQNLPHKYYEENLLHTMMIARVKDFDRAIELTDKFLPYVDNWAVCDTFNPKVFAKYKDALWQNIQRWIISDKTYTVRFGIVNAMRYFLDDDFDIERFEEIVAIKRDEYYIDMAIAWYMSVALVKQYEVAKRVIEERMLDKAVHNKSIQKAIESFRVSDDKKLYLRSLKY